MVGAARAFAMPAAATILPRLLSPAEFANANAWTSSTFQLAAVTGPALAGALIAWTGTAALGLAVAAAGQLLFVSQLARLPEVHPLPGAVTRGWDGVFEGFRFVRRSPIYLAAITLDLFAVLFGGATALLPIFAKDVLQVGPAGLGWLRAAPAVGATLMALVQTRLAPWQHPGRVLLVAVAGFGVATIGLGLSRNFVLSLACLFATGVCDSVSVVIRLTLEQVITPDALRGRVSAIKSVFVGFSNEFGAFESGATAALFGPVAVGRGRRHRRAAGGGRHRPHLAGAVADRAAAHAARGLGTGRAPGILARRGMLRVQSGGFPWLDRTHVSSRSSASLWS